MLHCDACETSGTVMEQRWCSDSTDVAVSHRDSMVPPSRMPRFWVAISPRSGTLSKQGRSLHDHFLNPDIDENHLLDQICITKTGHCCHSGVVLWELW